MKKIFKYSTILLLIGLIAVATFLATLFLGGFGKIPSKKDLESIKNESATLIISKDGELIGKLFSENRTNISYDSLPQSLVNALIATEDARFYEHEGIDGVALLRVLFKSILLADRSSGGGSTLSQQLAKNLFGRKEYGKISVGVNKLKEIILANRLESIYSKEEIIELYFNTVPFGENVYGIEAAAQRFFTKSVSKLQVEEAAMLVGMLKANTKYNPKLHPENALNRRSIVLHQMNKYNYLSNKNLDSINSLPLTLNYSNLIRHGKAPYFVSQVEKELKAILTQVEKSTGVRYDYKKDGLTVNSTLNSNLQLAAQNSLKKHLSKMQKQLDKLYSYGVSKKEITALANKLAARDKIDINDKEEKERRLFYWENQDSGIRTTVKDSIIHILSQLHAGILALNPNNGAIAAWVGGINFMFYPFDQLLAKRQLASTFKPILYAEALRKGRNLCDYISNEPIELSDYDNWSPSNYDGKSGGSYSLAAALAYSKNIPTVHLYFETELSSLAQLWNNLGFIDNLNEGPSVILGTNSVNALELAVAYSTFANNGKLVNPYTIESIYNQEGELIYKKEETKSERVLDVITTKKINTILEKAINQGTGNAIRNRYGLKFPFAGKTGTSQNYADAWFVGYNKNLLIVSRVGASYPSIHFKSGSLGSGSALALPLTALTLKEAILNDDFRKLMYNSQLNSIGAVGCDDFKEADFVDQIFNVFKKKESSLENEQKRAKKKKKVKGFFKKVFGD